MGNCGSVKVYEYIEKQEEFFLDRVLRNASFLLTANLQEAQNNAKNKYLMDIDRNTTAFIILARQSASASNGFHPAPDGCKNYLSKGELETVRLPNIPFEFLKHDEDSSTDLTSFMKIFGALNQFGMVERNPVFFSRIQDIKTTTHAAFGDEALPGQTVYWHYWDNHVTLKHMAFSGLMSYFLTGVTTAGKDNVPADAVYQVDLTRWGNYRIRRVNDVQEKEYSINLNYISDLIGKKQFDPPTVVDSEASASNPELYYRYGATLYFDQNKDPIGIWWPEFQKLVLTTDPEFQIASIVFRSTFIAIATIECHLIAVHWTIANSGAVICTTKLNKTHPIRRLLKPHIYLTPSVNFLSTASLAPIKGLAYRLCGFNAQGWTDMITDSLKRFKYESIDEHFAAANLPQECKQTMPLYQDGCDLWEIICVYVSGYVDIFYDSNDSLKADNELVDYWNGYLNYFGAENKDKGMDFPVGDLTKGNLIKQITYHIFWVTVGHEFMGDVFEYLQDPTGCPAKVYRDHSVGDAQTFLQALVLISLTTGNPCKLVNDWAIIWNDPVFTGNPVKHQMILQNLKHFQTSLKIFGKEVERRNTLRPQPMNAFNPLHASCSVSV